MALLSGVLVFLLTGCGAQPAQPATSRPAGKPGVEGGATLDGRSMPPWPAPDDVSALAAAAGLDLGPMGTAEHYHPHLRIIIGGKEVPVPAGIGVDPANGAMSALHTHEADGTLHVEADTVGETFTLGQLFTQWGVKLTATQIGGAQVTDGSAVALTSDGAPVAGDPAQLRLRPEQMMVLRLP